MMRYFKPTGSIDTIDIYIVVIEMYHYPSIDFHNGNSNKLKNILYVKKVGDWSTNHIEQKHNDLKKSLMIGTLSIKSNQVVNKSYQSRLASMKILRMIKV